MHLLSFKRMSDALKYEGHHDAQHTQGSQPPGKDDRGQYQEMSSDKQWHREQVNEQIRSVLVHRRRLPPRPGQQFAEGHCIPVLDGGSWHGELHDDVASSIDGMRTLTHCLESVLPIQRNRRTQNGVREKEESIRAIFLRQLDSCAHQNVTKALTASTWIHGHPCEFISSMCVAAQGIHANHAII